MTGLPFFACHTILLATHASTLSTAEEAIAAKQAFAKALLAQFEVRLQNPAYAYLWVANFRQWNSPIIYPNEVDKVVQT